MSKGGCILAIDLGTSGPKVALTTMQGRVLGCASHPTELHLLPGGGAEQDPADWWAAIAAATAKLHAQRVAPAESVEAVAVTSQWAGTVPIDRDGRRRLDWESLSQRIHPAASRVNMLAEQTPAMFIAFDLLAVGGRDLSADKNSPRLERYDPAADRWERLPEMPTARPRFSPE